MTWCSTAGPDLLPACRSWLLIAQRDLVDVSPSMRVNRLPPHAIPSKHFSGAVSSTLSVKFSLEGLLRIVLPHSPFLESFPINGALLDPGTQSQVCLSLVLDAQNIPGNKDIKGVSSWLYATDLILLWRRWIQGCSCLNPLVGTESTWPFFLPLSSSSCDYPLRPILCIWIWPVMITSEHL